MWFSLVSLKWKFDYWDMVPLLITFLPLWTYLLSLLCEPFFSCPLGIPTPEVLFQLSCPHSILYSPPRDCPIYLKMIPAFLSSPNMGSPPCLCIIISPGWRQSSLYVNTMQMFFNIQLNNTCFVNPCFVPGSAMVISSLIHSALPVSPLLPSHSVGLCLSLLNHLPCFYGKSLF